MIISSLKTAKHTQHIVLSVDHLNSDTNLGVELQIMDWGEGQTQIRTFDVL